MNSLLKEDWPLVAEGLLEDAWNKELSVQEPQQATEKLSEKQKVLLLQTIAEKQQIRLPETQSYEEIRAWMIKSWSYDEGASRSLAIRRAKAIKDYLSEQGVEAERIFILDVKTPAASSDGESAIVSKLELTSE